VPATTDFVSVRGDLDAIVGPSATLEAFDLQGQLIGSIFHTDAAGETWSISAPGIHSVKWSGVAIPDGTAGGIALDDLTFDTLVPAPPVVPPAAPVPGAVSLGLLGAAFVPLARRYCRR
jgi:hypothetical protein